MFRAKRWRQEERRSRARDRAAWLIRDHGDAAEEVLLADMARAGLSAAERRRMRMIRSELRRQRRQAVAPGEEVRPPVLDRIGHVAAMFGLRFGRRRRSRRRRS